MEDIVNEAVGLFKIKLRGYSISKAAYLLDSESGPMILKRQSNIGKIDELHKVAEALRGAGFMNAERFLTSGGKPYARLTDGFYTISSYNAGGKCNLADIEAVTAIAKTAARLHNACTRISEPSLDVSKIVSGTYYEKRLAEAKHIKKWLGGRSRLADIDVLYIKKYAVYLKRAQEAAEWISGYVGNIELLMCIGEFKEDNILIDDSGNVTLLNLENSVMSAPGEDLCQLIRRFVKRGGNTALINEIVNAYGSERSLTARDTEFVNAYLSFPHKFFTLVNRYYNSRRAYDNSYLFHKLKAEAAYQDRIFEALNNI